MSLKRIDAPPVLGESEVVLPMVSQDGRHILVEVLQEVLASVDPSFPGAMGELIERHRSLMESIASRKFDAEGDDENGVVRITMMDLSDL